MHNPRAVTLVCDTTFYGKRKDKLATVVFYDAIQDEILLWRHVDSEKSKYYKEMLQELLSLGYIVNSVTIDGKRGLNTVFKSYPIQMCHFHQRKIVDRYITKNPKLEASIELQKILTRLTKTTETRFKNKLLNWHTDLPRQFGTVYFFILYYIFKLIWSHIIYRRMFSFCIIVSFNILKY